MFGSRGLWGLGTGHCLCGDKCIWANLGQWESWSDHQDLGCVVWWVKALGFMFFVSEVVRRDEGELNSLNCVRGRLFGSLLCSISCALSADVPVMLGLCFGVATLLLHGVILLCAWDWIWSVRWEARQIRIRPILLLSTARKHLGGDYFSQVFLLFSCLVLSLCLPQLLVYPFVELNEQSPRLRNAVLNN